MCRHCKDSIYTPSTPEYKVNINVHADMQNVPLLPLGDITNGCQPTSVDLDEKKEQIKARRRAAYRKKKEEAASKQQDENLAALMKSGKDVLCFSNTMTVYTFLVKNVGDTCFHAIQSHE